MVKVNSDIRIKENTMLLAVLALIPVIALLIFIYLKDKNEKEPIGLLIGLFFAGMGTIITAVIWELIGEVILEAVLHYAPVLKAILLAVIVVGPAEELGKFAVLRLITWKNKNFNYSYDAIVYAVFVSLGFACLENIGYVFSNGIGAALLRMFTSVPGHAGFAVFMGFFYSKAKYAAVTGKKSECRKNIALSIIIPTLLHGIFDAILFAGEASDVDFLTGMSVLLWLGFVIVLLVFSFILVFKASKNDFCIVTLPDNVQTVYRPAVAGNWTCSCGTINYFNYCSACGKQRPMLNTTWNCPKCGTLCTYNFCGNCGTPKAPVQS